MKFARAMAGGNGAEAGAHVATALARDLEGAAPRLVLAMASTKQDLGSVQRVLRDAFPGALVLGTSTAGAFIDGREEKGTLTGVAVAGDMIVEAGLGRGLRANVEEAVKRATERLSPSRDGYPHRTAVLLLDPLAGVSEEATLLVAAELGEGLRLAGGAAGDDLRMTETVVACDDDLGSDSVVVAVLHTRVPLGVGVAHGHVPLDGEPVKVTRAEGGVVHEIDGRPAWEVWKEKTRTAARAVGIDVDALDPEERGAYLLRFEAGLATGGAYKIRAPLSVVGDGALQFACGLPEGAVVRVTESVPSRQVESARDAARKAREDLDGDVAGAIVFDCICRNLILGPEFTTAVDAIADELGAPIAGYETYGEIALEVGDLSGFHNTTTVVLAFPR